jgi:recombination protein U
VPKQKHIKKTAKNNSGKLAEQELTKSSKQTWKSYPHFWRRIADTNTYAINYCRFCGKTSNTNYIGQKELADFELVFDRETIYIEVKTSKIKTSYPISNIKDHQREAWKILKPYGIHHYFFIINRHQRGNFKLYVIEGEKLDDLISKIETRRKSIPWKQLERHSELVLEREHSLWLLGPFFEYVRKTRRKRISNTIGMWERAYNKLSNSGRKELINKIYEEV